MGVDRVPTVKICKPTGDQAAVLAQTIADIGTGKINTGTVTGLDDYNGYVPKASAMTRASVAMHGATGVGARRLRTRARGRVGHEAVRRGRRVRRASTCR